jgi:hypothetical protein
MSDEIDIAANIEQLQRDTAINIARQLKTKILSTGKCLHCDIEIEGDRRWCDVNCRDDWEKTYSKLR